MMISPNIDIGQLIIAGLIATVGWFIKRELTTLVRRLDKHDDAIFTLANHVQRLIGFAEGSKKTDSGSAWKHKRITDTEGDEEREN